MFIYFSEDYYVSVKETLACRMRTEGGHYLVELCLVNGSMLDEKFDNESDQRSYFHEICRRIKEESN